MTFSIVAIVPQTGDVGVAVASKFLAVGSIVPWVAAGQGAVATQALANTTFGPDGLARLGQSSAADVLPELLARDDRADRRQVGMVGADGVVASHTGAGCQPWAGHRLGDGFACQGNCLAGPQVIDAMVAAYEASSGPLAQRLFSALAAGDQAGGDRRGRQSAAIKIMRKGAGYQGLGDTVLDLRVDDHVAPITELARLMELHELYFPAGPTERLPLAGAVLDELRSMLRRAGWSAPAGANWDPDLHAALEAFAGNENLEERIDLDRRTIDRIALEHLRRVFPAADSIHAKKLGVGVERRQT